MDIDPRVLAMEDALTFGPHVQTDTPNYLAVRDWAAELPPQAAAWLAHAVHSGHLYSAHFTE